MTNPHLEVVRLLDRLFNHREYDVVDALVSPDFVDHDKFARGANGPQGFAETARAIHEAFTDPLFITEEALLAGDRLVLRVRFSGKHTGEAMGVPATNRTFSIRQIQMFRVVDGKIVEHWAVRNDRDLLEQVGVLPSPLTYP
jgi:steroid delta-isomerase-like uncharacterized protein